MAKEEESSLLTPKVLLEWISTIAIAAAIFGFLIVNTNLAAYGLWDFNFFRVEYISAGMLFIVLLFIIVIPIIFAYDKVLDLETHRKDSKTSFIKRALIKPLEWLIWIGSIVPLGFFLYLFVPIEDSAIKVSFVVLIGMIVILFVSPTISIATSYYKDLSKPKDATLPSVKEITKKWLMSFGPFYIMMAFLGIVLIFGMLLYPLIPHSFGGGRPIFVQINFADNSFGATSTIATLIYETPDFTTFNTGDGTYSVRTSAISSVEYLESVPSFRILLPALMYGKVATSSNK